MQSIFKSAIICLVFVLVCTGCAALLNPDREFAMTLNGSPYWANHAPAIGSLLELESGMNLSYQVRIIYPLASFGQVKNPGLEIVFDPGFIKTGKVINFDAGSSSPRLQIRYYPARGHRLAEGEMLVFSLYPEGQGSIIFESLDPRYGGHVKGVLQRVILYGYYESQDGMSYSTPAAPMELELRNFPFEVILEETWW